MSWGAVVTAFIILFLFAFGHGYLFESQYSFYRDRATVAVGDSTGAPQLSIGGITGHFNDLMTGLVIIPVS